MNSPSGRIMALDYGQRQIGVALSDPTRMIATGHGVIRVEDGEQDAAFAQLLKIVADHDVELVVVGLPLRMDGREGGQSRTTRRFGKRLQQRLPDRVPIEYWDERLSTAQAERALIAGGARRKTRKRVVDQLAAQLILQSYLDFKR